MGVAFVQQARNTAPSFSSSVAVTLTGVGAGNSLVVFTAAGPLATTVTVADDVDGAHTSVDELAANSWTVDSFLKENSSGGTVTVTATFSASNTLLYIWVVEVTGTGPSGVLDGHSTRNDATPGTGANGIDLSVTNAHQPALLVALSFDVAFGAGAPNAGTGFTTSGTDWASKARTEWKTLTTTGTQHATFTALGNERHFTLGVILDELSAQSVDPSGVATAQATGTARVDMNLTGSGVASAGAVGTPTLLLTIFPAETVTSEAAGTAVVTRGAVTASPSGVATGEAEGTASVAMQIGPSGLATSEAEGTAVVTPGSVDVAPSGVATGEGEGTARVDLNVAGTGVATAEAEGTATVTPGAATVAPAGLATAEGEGTAVVAPAAVTVTATGVATAEAGGSPVVTVGLTIAADGVATAEAEGTAVVTPGSVDVAPSGVATGEGEGTARVDLNVAGTGVATAEAEGTAVVVRGPATVSPSGLPSAEVAGSAAVVPDVVTVSPTGVAGASAFGTAIVSFFVKNTTSPIVGNFSPPDGAEIATTDFLGFDVTDDTGKFARIFVVVDLGGVTEVVHNGDRFVGLYRSSSTRSLVAGGFRYAVARRGGWPARAVKVTIHAIDRDGNEAGIVSEPAFTKDIVAPTVGNFAPDAGAPITPDGIVRFDVIDDSGLGRVLAAVALPSGIVELIHDGDVFAEPYDQSDRTPIANGYRYAVRRNGGWSTTGAAVSIIVYAFDTDGNEG